MIRHTHIAIITLALIASTACISIEATAQQAAPEQKSLQQVSPAATGDPDQQAARGPLAGAKAGLKLSAEQEKLWGPVEEALRNLQERTRDLRSSFGPGQPEDQIERLRRLGDLSAQRGDALKRLADAIQPLWATLSDEQKRELPRFVRVAAGQTDEDRMSGRGRDPGDRPGMEYRRRGGEGSDDPRGRMMGRGDEPNDQMSMGRRRQGGDERNEDRGRMMGRGDEPNDQMSMGPRRRGGDGTDDYRDRMMGRGDEPDDHMSMCRRHHGDDACNDHRGRMMGRGNEPDDQWSMGRRRQGGYRGDRDQRYEGSEQRGDRFGGYWGSQQDSRPRPREFDRDRRDFDRRSDSDRCRCYDRD